MIEKAKQIEPITGKEEYDSDRSSPLPFTRALAAERYDILRQQLLGIVPEETISGTVGLTSPRAWQNRWLFVDRFPRTVVESVSGLDNEEAWQLRNHVTPHEPRGAGRSLIGLCSDAAWKMRMTLIDKDARGVLCSLVGQEHNPNCSVLRKKYFSSQPDCVLFSYAGDDSSNAWNLREAVVTRTTYAALASTIGISTDRSFEFRIKNLHLPGAACGIGASLSGNNSPTAWLLRYQLERIETKALLWSLVGVFTEQADELRKKYLETEPQYVATSLSSYLYFGAVLRSRTCSGGDPK